MKGLWLSFCDTEKTVGEQFLGVVITEFEEDFMVAVCKTRRLGINPGGEVVGTVIELPMIDLKYHNKLLSEKELAKAGLL